MAINWDSIQPNPNGFAAGVGGIGEAFRARRERELRQQQMEMQAAQEAAQLEQQKANQVAIREHEGRRLASEEQRAQARMDFERQAAEREREDKAGVRAQDAIPKVADALRARRYSEAEMLGAAHGVALTPEPRPQDPGQYRPSPGPVRPDGPVNIEASPEDVDRQIQEREKYSRDNVNWITNEMADEEEHGNQARSFQEGKQGDPVYRLDYNGKPLAVYRGGEARAANEGDARRAAESFSPTAMEDFEKRSLAVMEREIANGMAPEKAMAAHTTRTENERNRMGAMDRARISASRPRGGSGSVDNERKAGVVRAQHDSAVKQVLDQFKFKSLASEENTLNELSALAGGATIGAGFATLLRGRFAKWGQGAGVLTDQDLNIFYNQMGGIARKYGTKVEDMISGTLTPAMQADISTVIDAMKKQTLNREAIIGRNIATMLKSRPGGEKLTDTYLQIYAPGMLRQRKADALNAEAAGYAGGGK